MGDSRWELGSTPNPADSQGVWNFPISYLPSPISGNETASPAYFPAFFATHTRYSLRGMNFSEALLMQ